MPHRGESDSAGPVGWMRVAHVLRVARTNPRLTNPAHVLVVEDDAGLRETLSSVLRDAGLACSTAPDGAAALEECQRSDPDLVILDLALPVLDGARFADAYRRIPGSGARILVISGIDRGAETASRLRADAFLSKPFGLDQLLAMAQRLLGLRAA